MLERGDTTTDFALDGQWFVDGFAGTMAELMQAIVADRAPEHAADDVVGSVRLMLAATRSAASGGQVVAVPRTGPGAA